MGLEDEAQATSSELEAEIPLVEIYNPGSEPELKTQKLSEIGKEEEEQEINADAAEKPTHGERIILVKRERERERERERDRFLENYGSPR
jgi:hypothetical protein